MTGTVFLVFPTHSHSLSFTLCLFSFALCNWRQNWHANKFCRKRGSLFLASQFV